jgi:hypothetical protein
MPSHRPHNMSSVRRAWPSRRAGGSQLIADGGAAVVCGRGCAGWLSLSFLGGPLDEACRPAVGVACLAGGDD